MSNVLHVLYCFARVGPRILTVQVHSDTKIKRQGMQPLFDLVYTTYSEIDGLASLG